MKYLKKYMFLFAIIILNGCEDPNGPGNCPNSVSVTVQITDPPVFSWNPPCEADGIIVYHHVISTSGMEVKSPVWSINTTETPISSPVTYGINPPGITLIVAPLDLIEGELYSINVIRNLDGIATFDFIGGMEFVYNP